MQCLILPPGGIVLIWLSVEDRQIFSIWYSHHCPAKLVK